MGIPFRCNKCHAYGHLFSDCSLSFKNKKLVFVPKLKLVWWVKIDGKQLGDSGFVNFDEMVDIK